MLGSALPSSAYAHTSAAPSTATTPTRPSRLRGLSYLRNYTHRDSPPTLSRTVSSPGDSTVASNSAANSAANTDRPTPVSNSAQVQHEEGGWVPTVQGRPVMARARAAASADTTPLPSSAPSQTVTASARTRTTNGVRTPHATNTATPDSSNRESLPTIRLIPHVELRASRPSLQFTAVSRTLKQTNNIVRVGRYSERDNVAESETTVAPIGFKSKVVSRRHCEFWCANGQWYVKDVKSSSGTFLNHVRLSAPGVESRPYPVNDGDVVQLGIDFKGGEELIFRCVKIRVECNRGWQKSLNNFNTTAHRRLLKQALKTNNRDSDVGNSSECSICLNPVAPCQALFVAPCSHVWHFKCIRNLIQGPNYPNFLCPNCRFNADLEADVEQPEFDVASSRASSDEEPLSRVVPEDDLDLDPADHEDPADEEDVDEEEDEQDQNDSTDSHLAHLLQTTVSIGSPLQENIFATDEDAEADLLRHQNNNTVHPHQSRSSSSAPSQPLPITPARDHNPRPSSPSDFLAAGTIADGPMTPRNDVGPFVFDGGAGHEATDLAGRALQEVTGDSTRLSSHRQ